MSSLRLCEHHKLTRLVCVVAARRFVLSISAVHSRAQFYFVINFNVNDARCEMNVIIISHRCVCSCVVAYVFRDCLRQADVFFFFIAINLTQNRARRTRLIICSWRTMPSTTRRDAQQKAPKRKFQEPAIRPIAMWAKPKALYDEMSDAFVKMRHIIK